MNTSTSIGIKDARKNPQIHVFDPEYNRQFVERLRKEDEESRNRQIRNAKINTSMNIRSIIGGK